MTIISTHKCDLCSYEITGSPCGHANAITNDDNSLNYFYIDQVSFPTGWVKVGVNVVCEKCFGMIKSI